MSASASDNWIQRQQHPSYTFIGGGGGASPYLDDASTRIYNAVDATKEAKFDCSGITTGTTKDFKFPDLSGTFALTTGVQSLADKSLSNAYVVSKVVTSIDQDISLVANPCNILIVNAITADRYVTLPSVITSPGVRVRISKGIGNFRVIIQPAGGSGDGFNGYPISLILYSQFDYVDLIATTNNNWVMEYLVLPVADSTAFRWLEFGLQKIRSSTTNATYRLQVAQNYWYLANQPVIVSRDTASVGTTTIEADQVSVTDTINNNFANVTLHSDGDFLVCYPDSKSKWFCLSNRLLENKIRFPNNREILLPDVSDTIALANYTQGLTNKTITTSLIEKKVRRITGTVGNYYASENVVHINTTGAGSAVYYYLPNYGSHDGLELEFYYAGGTQVLFIDTNATGFIETQLNSITLYTAGDYVKLFCDGTAGIWRILSYIGRDLQVNVTTPILNGHRDRVINVNNAGGVTMTIPESKYHPNTIYRFFKESTPANALNLTLSGADTYDGSATTNIALTTQYASVTLRSRYLKNGWFTGF